MRLAQVFVTLLGTVGGAIALSTALPSRADALQRRSSSSAKPAARKKSGKPGKPAAVIATKEIPEHAIAVNSKPLALPPPVPPPAPEPVPKGKGPSDAQHTAAQELYDFAVNTIRDGKLDELGTSKRPSAFVRAHQTTFGKLKADGVYGPKTQARGSLILGHPFPARPKPAKHAKHAPVAPPPPAPAAAPPPAPESPAAPAAADKRRPTQAAQELLDYVVSLTRDDRGDELGSTHAPNETVRAAQADMNGKLKADGIYGPKTQARGKELLGREMPGRAYVAPRGRSSEDAASDLYDHVVNAIRDDRASGLGTKAHPSAFVRAAQRDIGHVTSDGVYGPKTQARAAALAGKEFPARPK